MHYHWGLTSKWILWVSDGELDPAFTWTWFTCHALKPWFFIGSLCCFIGARIYERAAAMQAYAVLFTSMFLLTDHLLRTASQHSDSSGFAEDSADCLSLNHLQVLLPVGVGTLTTPSVYGDLSMSYCRVIHQMEIEIKCLEYRSWLSIWL